MNERYLMAVDAGTTSVKTVIFDTAGHQIASSLCEYSLEHPASDMVEVDPEVYWSAARQGIAATLADAALSPEQIAAVGVTSQGETLIVLDKNGKPLRKAIVWLDNRATVESGMIAERFGREKVYHRTGQQDIVPAWTAAKILWIRRNQPEIFAGIGKILMVADYIIYRLTGVFRTDHALNPSTLYYDIVERRWWTEMLEFLNIGEHQLPRLANSGESAANALAESGLSENTIICPAPIDQVAAALGAGNIAPGMITETTGSAMAICATLDSPRYDEQMRIGLYQHAIPGNYVMMPWVPTAGMVLRWFRDELGAGLDYSGLSSLAAPVPAGCDGLVMLPFLSGSFCPEINPDARGVFYGISLAHKQAHFVRAALEAVAFLLRHNIETLENAGVKCSSITSLGGGARDELWLQIKADVLNRPVHLPVCGETTCLGAAILAAKAAGLFSSIGDAVKSMVHMRKTIQPIPQNVEVYGKFYQKYIKINNLIMPSFGEKS